jgi:hypothetical protein
LLDPQKTRVDLVVDSIQIGVIRTIGLLVWKYLEGTEADVGDVKDVLAVDTS